MRLSRDKRDMDDGVSWLASHADVLRGSSRVPAPVSGAGTRDEALRNVCVGGYLMACCNKSTVDQQTPVPNRGL